jgi:MFS transporter, putative metabolite:H+ symporter
MKIGDDGFVIYDEKNMADEMVIAEARHIVQRRQDTQDCACKDGMFPLGQHGFSKSILFITLITTGGVPGFYTAATLLERIGRKPTTALFLSVSALMAYIYGHSSTNTTSFSGVIMQFFMFGMWSCLYAYTPELYPTRALSTGAGMASAFGRVGTITGPIVVGYIIGTVGDTGVFTLGAASFVAAALIVLILGIKTRGRTLEEICSAEELSSTATTIAATAGLRC